VDHAHLIEKLDGPTAVANAIGAPVQTVHSWKKNGIPQWRRPVLAELARRKGVELPADFIATPADSKPAEAA